MPKICDITGKKVQFGHNVSKANNKTKRKFSVNLQSVTFKSQVLNKNLKFTISTSAMRTVLKYGGIDDYLSKTLNKKLSSKVKIIQKTIQKLSLKAS